MHPPVRGGSLGSTRHLGEVEPGDPVLRVGLDRIAVVPHASPRSPRPAAASPRARSGSADQKRRARARRPCSRASVQSLRATASRAPKSAWLPTRLHVAARLSATVPTIRPPRHGVRQPHRNAPLRGEQHNGAGQEGRHRDADHLPVPVERGGGDPCDVGAGGGSRETAPPAPDGRHERSDQRSGEQQDPDDPDLAEGLGVQGVRVADDQPGSVGARTTRTRMSRRPRPSRTCSEAMSQATPIVSPVRCRRR